MTHAAAFVLTGPPGLELFPAEQVLLLAVDFPPMTAAQRRAAAPFAVEERIAAPLDDVHVALVAPLSAPVQGAGQNWLVAVVAKDAIAALGRAGSGGRRLVPETLCLPQPSPGEWSVAEKDDRMIVRLPDGTGMAMPAELFCLAHRMAGLPGIVLFTGDLSRCGVSPLRRAALPDRLDPAFDGLDLRALVPRGPALPALRLRRIAAVAALAGLGHIAIAGADVAALAAALESRRAAFADIATLAGLSPAATPAEVLAARDAGAAGPDQTRRLAIPMVGQAAEALAAVPGGVTLRDMRYLGEAGELTLVIEGPDLAALQAAAAALARQGLAVEAGPAVNDGGLAEQTVTLRRGGTP
jgi:general secretion pathway protein L